MQSHGKQLISILRRSLDFIESSPARQIACAAVTWIFLSAGAVQVCAKAFVFEGFIETAPSGFAAPVTHVMKFDPAGKIELALVGDRLQSRPLERIKIFGRLAADIVTNGVPLIRVEEIWPAEWSFPQSTLSPVTAANWIGAGSSLYPNIREEPLPRAGFEPLPAPPIPLMFSRGSLAYNKGAFSFQVTGPEGRNCIIDGSHDFVVWRPLVTNVLAQGKLDVVDSDASRSFRFYRARLDSR